MNNYSPITERTKSFAVRIIKACSFLSNQSDVSKTLPWQLLRSGTSIGANVHEGESLRGNPSSANLSSQSAQSDKDFINKLEIALKEARETEYWLEILLKSELVTESKFKPLLDECQQIVRILIASTGKLKQKS